MAKPKSKDKETNFSVRCSEETLAALQDLARLSRSTVSALVANLCAELVKMNKTRITNFRKQAATPIKMPTFSDSAPAKKKPAPITTNTGDDVINTAL